MKKPTKDIEMVINMNGKIMQIEIMTCDCGVTSKYDIHNSVSFVDAHRTIRAKCKCEVE